MLSYSAVYLSLVNMYKFVALTLLVGVALAIPTAKISPALRSSLETKHTANIMVSFVGGNKKVVNSVENRVFSTRTERLNALKSDLEAHAQASQQQVHKFLKEKKIHFRSFWVNNKIYIKGADKELVHALATFAEVSEVEEERILQIQSTVETGLPKKRRFVPPVETGLERIEVEYAWRVTNGTGVVAATIDTGVRYTHESIVDKWRADHGWMDPTNRTDLPNDQNGHGTHTMGVICGSGGPWGIGVAPGSQWISCKGCPDGICPESALTACGEWVVCPTNPDGSDPDCSKAPALVSNAWGGPGGDLWYEDVTEAWIAGGIVPLFPIGNSGDGCGTCGSPGDYRRVIGVGALDYSESLWGASGVGPAQDGRIKPDLTAPGEYVLSCDIVSDRSYVAKTGTSMGCSHVAGVTALLLSMQPDLTFEQVRQSILNGTDQDLRTEDKTCDSLNDEEFPNHHFGWGITNAWITVQNAQKAL